MAEIKDILTRLKNYIDQEDNNEQTRAENAEEALNDKIEQEIADRTADVIAEETRASDEETRIEGKLDDYISSNNQALANEIERAQGEESRIEAKLDSRIDTEIQDRENDVDAEESRALAAESTLQDNIDTEVTRATNIENILRVDLTTESETARNAEDALNARINDLNFEAGADGSYIKYINQENGQVSAATQPFDTVIPNEEPSAINAPTTAAVKVYTDAETSRAIDREDEIEDSLDNYIEVNDQALEDERTVRATGDANSLQSAKNYTDNEINRLDENLQGQIDGINAGQNLADIVAGLIELAAYPTEKLQEGDKVQVLVDLNHDNASTVWNWTGTKTAEIDSDHINGFDYIGKYGQNAYTIAEVDELLNRKQNVINNNNKLNANLVDDTSAEHKFATSAQLTQIETNRIAIADIKDSILDIKDSTQLKSFSDVDNALALKADKLTTYTKEDIDGKLENIPLALYYEDSELYEVFSDGRTQPIVTAAELRHDAGLDDAEHTANKVTYTAGWSATPSDDKYPSEKLVKAELDDKIGKFEPVVDVHYGPWSEGLASAETTLLYAKKDLDTEEWSYAPLFTISQLRTDLGFLTAFQNTPDDTHFVSEKLVKEKLDEKATLNGENTFNGNINLASGYDLVANGCTGYFDTLYIKNNQTDVDITDLFATKAILKNVLWDSAETYADGQIVFYNRHLYICIAPIEFSSVTPPDEDTNNWTALFVQNN